MRQSSLGILWITTAFAVAACRTETVLEPTQFTIAPRDALVQEGMVLQLKPLVATDGPEVSEPIQWSSSLVTVASVDANGMVTAVAPGTTVVTAKSGTVGDSMKVTVQPRNGATLTESGALICGVTVTSGAVCWGVNTFGQTGNGLAVAEVLLPTPVAGSVKWKALDAATSYACGIDVNNDVYCWGLNASGQLGLGNESDPVRTPTRVTTAKKFVSVSVGGSNWVGLRNIELTDSQLSCALTVEGEAYCWGVSGLFATTGETPSNVPRPVAPGIRFASLSVGYAYVCGVAIDHRAWCWGNNELGQLGRTQAPFDRGPKVVEGGLHFDQISAGGIHTCAVTTDGIAYCWGANEALQLGDASTEQCSFRGRSVPCQTHPVAVSGGYKFTSISAGGWGAQESQYMSHSCGITTGQDVICWGLNGSGQVRGYRDNLFLPQFRGPTVTELAGIKFRAISTGVGRSCAVTVAGLGYCWGLTEGPTSFDERFK